MKAAVIEATPGTNDLVFTEPVTRESTPKSRTINYEWLVGPDADDDEGGTKLAVLAVYHYSDRKAFLATLHNETSVEWKHGMVRKVSLGIGKPPAFRYVERVDRFSAKRFHEFAERALGELRAHAQDPAVAAIFGIEPVTSVRVAEQHDGESSLTFLQRLVGGDIEPVTLDPKRYEGYVHEEGKFINGGLYRNEVATALWSECTASLGLQRLPGDYIAGPLVIVGPLDDDGGTTGVTDDVIAQLTAYVEVAQS